MLLHSGWMAFGCDAERLAALIHKTHRLAEPNLGNKGHEAAVRIPNRGNRINFGTNALRNAVRVIATLSVVVVPVPFDSSAPLFSTPSWEPLENNQRPPAIRTTSTTMPTIRFCTFVFIGFLITRLIN